MDCGDRPTEGLTACRQEIAATKLHAGGGGGRGEGQEVEKEGRGGEGRQASC